MELRQELKQEVTLSLRQIQQILEEFFIQIEIDKDEDQTLLNDSMLFLLMHELSHPVFDRYRKRFNSVVPYQIIPEYQPHAKETIVDALAYEGGLSIGESKLDLVESHCALAERAYLNAFERNKSGHYLPFLARLAAELDVHAEESKLEKIGKLAAQFDQETEEAFGSDYKDVKELYREIYVESRKIANKLVL